MTRTLRYIRAKPKRSQSYVRWIRSPSPSRCRSVLPDLVCGRPRRACIDPRLLKRRSRPAGAAVPCCAGKPHREDPRMCLSEPPGSFITDHSGKHHTITDTARPPTIYLNGYFSMENYGKVFFSMYFLKTKNVIINIFF